MSIETLFELAIVESKAAQTREKIAGIEAVAGWLDLSEYADANLASIVEAELDRALKAEKAILDRLQARLDAVGTKERLAMVEHALEACRWQEVTDQEEQELEAERALLRCRLLREQGKAPAPISTFDLVRAGEVFDLRLT